MYKYKLIYVYVCVFIYMCICICIYIYIIIFDFGVHLGLLMASTMLISPVRWDITLPALQVS